MRGVLIGLVLLLSGLRPDAAAQTESERVCATLRLFLHPEVIPGTREHAWVVDLPRSLKTLSPELEPESDSQCAAHSSMMRVFFDQVRKELEERAQDRSHPWVVPANLLSNPPDNLPFLSLPSATFEDLETSDLPPAPSPEQTLQRNVRLFAELKPIKKLILEVDSADKAPPSEPDKPVPFTEVAAALRLPSRSADSNIQVLVRPGTSDIAAVGRDKALLELYSVAAQMRETAERVQFTPGNPGGLGCSIGHWGDLTSTTQEFADPFCISLQGGMNMCTLQVDTPDIPENNLRIRATDVVLIRKVLVEPAEEANKDAVAIVRKRRLAQLNREMAGRVLRSEELGRTIYELSMDSYVRDAKPSLNEGRLTFDIQTRPVYKKLVFGGGVAYSAEKSTYATANISTENLMELGEKASLTFSGGRHYRAFDVSIEMPESLHPARPGSFWFRGAGISGGYLFNDKKHMEGIPEEVKDEQSSLTGEAILAVDSFSAHDLLVSNDAGNPQLRRLRHLATLTPGFEISSLHNQEIASGRSFDSGQVTALSIRPAYAFAWDLRPPNGGGPGFSEFRAEVSAGFTKAGRWAGADFSYDIAELSGTAQINFGIQDTKQFLLRGRAGLASASRGAPSQRQLQIGGSDYVRGIERGEYMAHALVWQQAEAGVSFRTIWRGVRSLWGPATAGKSAGGGPKMPFDTESSYLKIFFDHARISSTVSINRAMEAGVTLQGYGIAAELGRLKNRFDLTVGYGFSPQSVLHKRGTVFTGFGIRF